MRPDRNSDGTSQHYKHVTLRQNTKHFFNIISTIQVYTYL